jgi:multimeric flavodoxin WrbA
VQKLKVVGISGSPRKGCNTECLVNESLDEFAKNGWLTTKRYLSEKEIKPCTGCETCVKSSVCIINDDDAGLIFDQIT